MTPLRFLGVDPGQAGGLACLDQQGAFASPMPTTERDVWEWLSEISTVGTVAVIEKVHSMPKQGVASSFKFGKGYGSLLMALTAVKIPFELVTPQAWQKFLGIPKKSPKESKGQFKNRLRAEAQRLFPEMEIWEQPRSKGKQLAICDALLIAEYGRRKHLGVGKRQ